MLRKDSRKLPPQCEQGIFETIQIFMTGKTVPQFMLKNMRTLGNVFRLQMPEMVPWISVCDPAFARAILLEEDEKPILYSRFDELTEGLSTMPTSRTHGTNWGRSRKSVAPSFSMTNLCTTLPKMYEKIDELKRIFRQHLKDGSTFDIAEVTTKLTMDFICAGMLPTDSYPAF